MKDDPFNRPIRPIGEDEQDHLKIPSIEPIRDDLSAEEQEAYVENLKRTVSPSAAFVSFFRKLMEILHLAKRRASVAQKDDVLVEDLQKLKRLFSQLAERDQSENITFAQNLSDTWIAISYHCESIESGDMKSGLDPQKIRALVRSIGKYPEGTEHNLGHYLKHHAGKDWLPFPFMELLKKLHRSVAVDGQKAHLVQWISSLNELIPGKDIT